MYILILYIDLFYIFFSHTFKDFEISRFRSPFSPSYRIDVSQLQGIIKILKLKKYDVVRRTVQNVLDDEMCYY